MWKRNLLAISGCITLIVLIILLLQPCLFVETEQKLLTWSVISSEKETFSLQFIHSVERTPVRELYHVNSRNQVVLFATEYESFGVGLPFLASEGKLTSKEGYFHLEMNRVFPSISLRTWPAGQLTLTVKNQQHHLYQMLPSGAIVRISAGTWLSRLTKLFTTR